LVAVCLQGLLGGLTVHYLLPLPVSVAHGCLAQAFFCLTIVLAVVTSPSWLAFERGPRAEAPARAPWRLFALAAGVVYLQLGFGAVMRHMNAGLAVPVFPMPLSQIFPSFESAAVFVHVLHRRWAVLVTLCVLASCASLLRHPGSGSRLKAQAGLLLGLLAVQVTLGAWTIWTRLAPLPTSFHVANGAAILGACVLIGLRAYQRLASIRSPD
jgi:cytochrome c oxidase assembly protein subunit 15